MVKELVNSIIEAEKEAESIIAAAQEKANAIINKAVVDADQLISSAAKALKEDNVKWTKEAAVKAQQVGEILLSEGKDLVDKRLAKAKENIDKAAKIIMEELL